jgi:hypothetical protein
MGFDPYDPEMMAKYGAPGATDEEGFNPYADSVGPGIVSPQDFAAFRSHASFQWLIACPKG